MVVAKAKHGHSCQNRTPVPTGDREDPASYRIVLLFRSPPMCRDLSMAPKHKKDLRPEEDQGPPTLPLVDLTSKPALRSIFRWM